MDAVCCTSWIYGVSFGPEWSRGFEASSVLDFGLVILGGGGHWGAGTLSSLQTS